ncbi:MAG: 4-alpha-glucanotransferase [Butyrivibrio sp.]|nr:4-alpha-glucanotransferase [Butyrivibrio sp.]
MSVFSPAELDRRACGVLLPIFSLPSPHGIGALSREAYEFVDFLAAAGQSYWQILPLGPTSYGDSPYQSFSTFAGNPYFIDLDSLTEESLLTREEVDALPERNAWSIDYATLYRTREPVLRSAFHRSGLSEESTDPPKEMLRESFAQFTEDNQAWLADYALFMALKKAHNGRAWSEWEEPLRLREPEAMEQARTRYRDEITFVSFQQYLFHRQWKALKSYANNHGITIIGDIPIYVAYDSADTWGNPHLFQLDENRIPIAVAGCPPDAFSRTGQLWGNPLYRWGAHRETGYEWWMRRIRHSYENVDVLRIDHFRGFEGYYSIPWGEPTAEHGHWEPGPGVDFFRFIADVIGSCPVIAEDLGFLTPEVHHMREQTGYPGMKVLQFAFGTGSESTYLPHNYERNTVVYTGTHDNDTTRSWYEGLTGRDRIYADDYIGLSREQTPSAWPFIRMAMRSVADTAIIPMQDYLDLNGEARINEPSTTGNNWTWRMEPGAADEALAQRMRRLAEVTGR